MSIKGITTCLGGNPDNAKKKKNHINNDNYNAGCKFDMKVKLLFFEGPTQNTLDMMTRPTLVNILKTTAEKSFRPSQLDAGLCVCHWRTGLIGNK